MLTYSSVRWLRELTELNQKGYMSELNFDIVTCDTTKKKKKQRRYIYKNNVMEGAEIKT